MTTLSTTASARLRAGGEGACLATKRDLHRLRLRADLEHRLRLAGVFCVLHSHGVAGRGRRHAREARLLLVAHLAPAVRGVTALPHTARSQGGVCGQAASGPAALPPARQCKQVGATRAVQSVTPKDGPATFC